MRPKCQKCGKVIDKVKWRQNSKDYCDGECDCTCFGPGPNPTCPAHPNGW